MQDRCDAGQVECRTGGMQDRRNAGQERCRTGGMQDWRDAGQVGCRTGEMHFWTDAGKEGCRTGGGAYCSIEEGGEAAAPPARRVRQLSLFPELEIKS